jgi:peptide/nickel transport system substrate-binding protein
MAARHLTLAALLALLALAAPASAQPARDLAIGITQYPATWHPNIEPMAAKGYVEGFALQPLTAHDADWKLTCLLCETLPTLENGLAVRETTPDGKPGIRLTYRLRPGAAWADGRPVSAEDLRFAWEAGRNGATGFGPAEFYRRAYALEVVDARTVVLHLDKVTFDFAAMGDFQPLPAHLDRERWLADPRGYRSRTAYDTETTNPGLWNGPYRIATVTPGSTGNYGANAAFFINHALPTYANRVIKLNRLRGPTVVGYMFGGIYSTVSNTSSNTFQATGASNQVFQITMTRT